MLIPLRHDGRRIARYYLRAIELRRAGEPNPELGGIIEDTSTYNLEPVIPLRPSTQWNLSDEAIQAYSKRLGNMTLLDPTANVDLDNKTFAEKRPIYKASPLLITKEIAGFSKWGPDEVEKRQDALATDALPIWKI
jgi:Protein of unknown function (DUF1524)